MDAFVLTAYDHHNALERRMSCREEHIKLIDQLRTQGKALMGVALTDDKGTMVGSTIILKMTQAELDQYMKDEPYITNNVWERISVHNCRIGPSFLKN